MKSYKKTLLIIAIVMPACAMEPIWPTGELHPYTTENGEHRFRYVGHNKLDPIYNGVTTLDEIHRNQISGELGKQRYCQNGYTILSTEEIEKTDNIVYEGICK